MQVIMFFTTIFLVFVTTNLGGSRKPLIYMKDPMSSAAMYATDLGHPVQEFENAADKVTVSLRKLQSSLRTYEMCICRLRTRITRCRFHIFVANDIESHEEAAMPEQAACHARCTDQKRAQFFTDYSDTPVQTATCSLLRVESQETELLYAHQWVKLTVDLDGSFLTPYGEAYACQRGVCQLYNNNGYVFVGSAVHNPVCAPVPIKRDRCAARIKKYASVKMLVLTCPRWKEIITFRYLHIHEYNCGDIWKNLYQSDLGDEYSFDSRGVELVRQLPPVEETQRALLSVPHFIYEMVRENEEISRVLSRMREVLGRVIEHSTSRRPGSALEYVTYSNHTPVVVQIHSSTIVIHRAIEITEYDINVTDIRCGYIGTNVTKYNLYGYMNCNSYIVYGKNFSCNVYTQPTMTCPYNTSHAIYIEGEHMTYIQYAPTDLLVGAFHPQVDLVAELLSSPREIPVNHFRVQEDYLDGPSSKGILPHNWSSTAVLAGCGGVVLAVVTLTLCLCKLRSLIYSCCCRCHWCKNRHREHPAVKYAKSQGQITFDLAK